MNTENIGLFILNILAVLMLWFIFFIVGDSLRKNYEYDHSPIFEATAGIEYRWEGYDQENILRKQVITYKFHTSRKVEEVKVYVDNIQGSLTDGKYTLYGSIEGFDANGDRVEVIKRFDEVILIAPGLKPTDIKFCSSVKRLR